MRASKTGTRPPAGDQADLVDAADGGDAAQPNIELSAEAGVEDASASADAAGSGEASAPGSVDRGPYFESGSWHGYLWISHHGEGTTIAATNFSVPTFQEPVCIKGSVAPTPDNSGNAMLGLNVKQAKRVDAPTRTLVPSGAGIQVEVTNPGGSPLRIQVHAPDGATNGDARWCAMVNGSGGFVPWAQFNTACWDGSGNPYQSEPISSALLLVPGNTEMSVPYDVCLVGLQEADAAP